MASPAPIKRVWLRLCCAVLPAQPDERTEQAEQGTGSRLCLTPLLNQNQAVADAKGDGLGAAGRAQLAHDGGDVELNGMLGNLEAGSDLFVAETCREELQHFQFTRCQRFDKRFGSTAGNGDGSARSSVSAPMASRTTKPAAAASIAATISGPRQAAGKHRLNTRAQRFRNRLGGRIAHQHNHRARPHPPNPWPYARRGRRASRLPPATHRAANPPLVPRASPEESSTTRRAECA